MSVIIPTYNRATEVVVAIESALRQSHSAIEVIVVDDGSTDGTDRVIADRFGDDPRLMYMRQPNEGVSSARNKGLETFTGEFVCFLDSDDSWEPWKVSLQLECAHALPEVGMLWSEIRAVGPTGDLISHRYLRQMYQGYSVIPTEDLFEGSLPLAEVVPGYAELVGDHHLFYGDIYSAMAIHNFVHTSTVMVRADHARQVGGFDLTLQCGGEDHDFHLRTSRLGTAVLLDVPTTNYRVGGPDQLTRPDYSIHLARNYLRTISKAVSRDRDRIRLPPETIDRAFSGAHAWLGECLLNMGRGSEARHHFWRSVRLAPGAARSWAFLLLTCVPQFARETTRRLLRSLSRVTGLAPMRSADGVASPGAGAGQA